MVLATHDLAQARRLADRRLLLAAGRSVHEDSETAAMMLRFRVTWRKHVSPETVCASMSVLASSIRNARRLGLLGMRTIERNMLYGLSMTSSS